MTLSISSGVLKMPLGLFGIGDKTQAASLAFKAGHAPPTPPSFSAHFQSSIRLAQPFDFPRAKGTSQGQIKPLCICGRNSSRMKQILDLLYRAYTEL
jgi:hypothetical protein